MFREKIVKQPSNPKKVLIITAKVIGKIFGWLLTVYGSCGLFLILYALIFGITSETYYKYPTIYGNWMGSILRYSIAVIIGIVFIRRSK